MALDAGLIRNEEVVSPCRLFPMPKRPKTASDIHRQVGAFSSALTHLLVKTKLEDDILDDKSQRARFFTWLFRSKFAKSRQYFSKLDPNFEKTMNGFFQAHRDMELEDSKTSLTEYAMPTANAFKYVFGLFGVALNNPEYGQVFATVGNKVGQAIIYADCGYDWTRDQKKGLYNPVRTLEESAKAIAESQTALRDGTLTAKQAFREKCITEEILLGVHDRLYRCTERDKRYKPYLVPLNESTVWGYPKDKSSGIIMASNAACPTLMLFAPGIPHSGCCEFCCDSCCEMMCCCSLCCAFSPS